jgi:hypothetical protein
LTRVLLSGLAVSVLVACGVSPASLQYQGANPPNPYIGQATTLSFLALDANGNPLPGVSVDYTLQGNAAGVTLNASSSLTQPVSGVAQVTVTASQRITTVTIVATAGGVSATGTVAFASLPPQHASGAQLTFQCGEIAGAASGGVHALGAYDESRSLIPGIKVQCSAHVADRNGDAIVGAPVTFLTEAGAIEGSSTTVSDVNGNAPVLYKTSLPLPEDVDPGTFTYNLPTPKGVGCSGATCAGMVVYPHLLAPLWMQPYNWTAPDPVTFYTTPPATGTLGGSEPHRLDPDVLLADGVTHRQNNPRDNLVSLIAVTTGEEALVPCPSVPPPAPYTYDSNAGVCFLDLPEPFVDSNDDGIWEEGERFVDVNGNGVFDGPNGKWDSSSTIWTEERILWTGLPSGHDMQLAGQAVNPTYLQTVRLLSPDNYTGAGSGLPFPPPSTNAAAYTCQNSATIQLFGSCSFTFYVADPWFNAIAQNSPQDGCTTGTASQAITLQPNQSWGGAAMIYPAGNLYNIVVADVTVPQPPSGSPAPQPFNPAIQWTADPVCNFTDSPVDGFHQSVALPELIGWIF